MKRAATLSGVRRTGPAPKRQKLHRTNLTPGQPKVCHVCRRTLPSRNKLMLHLQDVHPAFAPAAPASPACHLHTDSASAASSQASATDPASATDHCTGSGHRGFGHHSPHYPLPNAAHCLLPTAHAAYCPLPAAHCPQHCLLPTAHCLLPTAYCPLPTAHAHSCPLPTVPTAHCPLPILPTASAHCLL